MGNMKYDDAVFLGLLLSLEHNDDFMKGYGAMASAAFGKPFAKVMDDLGFKLCEKQEEKSIVPEVLAHIRAIYELEEKQ